MVGATLPLSFVCDTLQGVWNMRLAWSKALDICFPPECPLAKTHNCKAGPVDFHQKTQL